MPPTGKTIEGIRFGPFLLDTAGRRLLRDGRRVPITPIELKLLETLLVNRDRVLTGDDLRLLVWSDDPSEGVAPAQDANALYVAIRKLRRSLGDHGRLIVNIPKVGYTLSEQVKVEGDNVDGRADDNDPNPFVGRKAELDKLKNMLSNSRLITLTGPPGIGKSRLASELAAVVTEEFPDGTFVVNLVPIENESLVAGAVLGALELSEETSRSETETICAYLKNKKVLMILDNCEHLIERCSGLVDDLIRKLPDLRVVATSLEPLLLPGETVMPVPPLGVSNGRRENDAVELFIKLAKQYRSDFEIEKTDPVRIGELCRHLEGLPLAIELAAAQVGAYTVDQIIEAMSDRFRLLKRRGGQNARHKTLEEAVDWSFSLLSMEERILIQRLSVFTGGWTVESARTVCAGDGLDEQEIIHLLAQLMRRSLVQMSPAATGVERYSMLETIRQFARRCLRKSGEEDQLLDRRDRYMLDLCEKAFDAGGDTVWLERSKNEYDNIRLALDRSIRRGRSVETGLVMCGTLAKFWFNYGHFREAKFWTKLALDADDGSSPEASAKALRTAGFFFGQFAGAGEDPETGMAYFDKSLAISRELQEESEEAFTLVHYSFLLYRLGQLKEAKEAAQKSLDISSARGDQANIARSANNLALASLETGETTEAKAVFEIALSAARLANDKYLEALCLYYLGETALRSADVENAEYALTRSHDLFTSIGNRPHAARSLLLQGEAAAVSEDHEASLELGRTALTEFLEIEDQPGIASALEAIACTKAMSGSEPGVFLMLTSSAAEIRRKSKLMPVTRRKDLLERLGKKARTSLGISAASAAAERGRTMSLAEAIEIALSQH